MGTLKGPVNVEDPSLLKGPLNVDTVKGLEKVMLIAQVAIGN